MRLLAPDHRRPAPGAECVDRRLDARAAVATVLAVLLAGLAVGVGRALPAAAQGVPATPAPATPAPDGVVAADAEIARLEAQADALADRYFEALGRLGEVQLRIDDVEARLPVLADEVADLRARTRERAVAAYKRSGRDLAAVIGAGDPLEAARRVRWLDRLNARDDALAAELRETSARLDAQRADLRAARESAAAALADVKAQGQVIDALLVDARERRRVAATPSTTADGADPGATTPTPPTTAAPAPDPKPAAPAVPIAPPSYTPTPGTHPRHDEPFLVCTRTRESGGRYTAVNPAGPYLGAYQFLQSTWNSAASRAGRPELVGVPPNTASPYDQDDLAWALYQWRGSGPWGGMCDPE